MGERFQQSSRLKKGSVPVRHSSAALCEKRGKIWREVGNGKYQGMKKMDHLFSTVFSASPLKDPALFHSLNQPANQSFHGYPPLDLSLFSLLTPSSPPPPT